MKITILKVLELTYFGHIRIGFRPQCAPRQTVFAVRNHRRARTAENDYDAIDSRAIATRRVGTLNAYYTNVKTIIIIDVIITVDTSSELAGSQTEDDTCRGLQSLLLRRTLIKNKYVRTICQQPIRT